MDPWIFILYFELRNLISLYFLAHIVPALALGSSCSWLLYPFDMAPSFFFFLAPPYFLALTGAPNSSCIFPALVLESATSPFMRAWYKKPSSRGWFVCCYGHFAYFRSFLLTEPKKCMCVYQPLNVHISVFCM